jgi:hypothetical protein
VTCPDCAQLQAELAALRDALKTAHESEQRMKEALEGAEHDLRYKRLRIDELKAKLAKDAEEHEWRPEVQEVYDLWRQLRSPRSPKTVTKDRAEKVQARLKELVGRSERPERLREAVEMLLDAVRGVQFVAFRDPRTGELHDDLVTICRDAKQVRRFAAAWHREQRRVQRAHDEFRRVEHERWMNTERRTVDPETGLVVDAAPPPLHVNDPRSPAERVFDQVILRHCLIARRPYGGRVDSEPLPPELEELEAGAEGRQQLALEAWAEERPLRVIEGGRAA